MPDHPVMSRIKRAEDVIVAAVALIISAPLSLGIAVLVFITMGRPVLFRQVRPGRHSRPFVLLKFRTMIATAPGRPLSDEERITPVGRFLRRTSLDELPQLWNVLKGEMSLVGPRPLLVDYLDRYTPEQARRHLVRPGITGLAQTSGRTSLDWDDAFALDCRYLDDWSLRLDHRILARTLVLLATSHRSPEDQSMRSEFRGAHP